MKFLPIILMVTLSATVVLTSPLELRKGIKEMYENVKQHTAELWNKTKLALPGSGPAKAVYFDESNPVYSSLMLLMGFDLNCVVDIFQNGSLGRKSKAAWNEFINFAVQDPCKDIESESEKERCLEKFGDTINVLSTTFNEAIDEDPLAADLAQKVQRECFNNVGN